MEDDAKFKEATGILKLIALGAHHVRRALSSVQFLRLILAFRAVPIMLPVMDRVHSHSETQASVRSPALSVHPPRRRTRTLSTCHPLLPHPRQQTLRLMGIHQLYEAARTHRRQLGRSTG